MLCPVCREPMIMLEYADVEVDFCTECSGVWLDEQELELLLGLETPDVANLISRGEEVAATEAKRPCPACDTPMLKEAFGGGSPIVYDRCPHNHGLFFDKGELVAVMEHAHKFAGGREISEFLRNIFVKDGESETDVEP
ncbi:MAG TPA: zf-TFIIB domain-containing protein [Candidatus Hydrogenedentes bacterium]|nr:zf-TFIIB domain-containing protein [Candidatus Hydrogenedentota bacterium]HQM50456.1 zf-TFIIB domain-containing protein [Candidatus Hydrogenedentota bacterium]